MANNSYNNKIQLSDGTVLIDLTNDTVEADKLLEGFTAHDASGKAITGIMFQVPLDPIAYDYEPGYTANGTFKYENSTNNHSDVYEVKAGHYYALILGETVGTRFRAAVIPSNPVGTLVDIPGTTVVNKSNPLAYDRIMYTSSTDAYMVVTKDNVSTKGLKSYVFDITPTN
jgi:hypothetical protein